MFTLKSKSIVIIILSLAELFALTLWFSANAIIPQLTALWNLSAFEVSLLSIFVIIGFVAGSLVSSFFSLPDVYKTKHVFALSAALGGLSNLIIAVFIDSLNGMLIFRFFTGFFLAGVYPTGMKLASTWFKKRRGFAISAIVGSLTIGSGLPFLFNVSGIPDWRVLLHFSTALAFISAGIVWLFIEEGPYSGGRLKFDISNIKYIIKNKAVRLANYGYFGHMWELYAMWAWIPIFLRESYLQSHPLADPLIFFSLGTFFVFLAGAIATVIGGILADRYGRIKFNMLALVISGSCCLVIGLFFGSNPTIVLLIAIIWGIAVIPDSPQYSALLTELCEKQYMGTALTLQTAIGFFITIFSIRLISLAIDLVGWNYAFSLLFFGPLFGLFSLVRLKKYIPN